METINLEKTKKPYHNSMEKGFFKVQKDLLYTDLSLMEILTYCYIVDKIELSKTNANFFDIGEANYFCVIPNQELMDFLQCGKTKVVEVKNKLEKRGLIMQERQRDKSNKIYINDYKIL